uniref:Uncharacterized protein n=1 Tax=Heliothis virescens TaxID=7102 RepID=A0A2A4JH69_HELVI
MTRYPAKRYSSDDKPKWMKSPTKFTNLEPEKPVPDILDSWRDPLAAKVHLGNPPDEQDDEGFQGHNLSML